MGSWLALAAAALLAATLLAACGDNGQATGVQPTPGGAVTNDPGPSPTLSGPASRFALSLDDMPEGYLTDRASTFVLDAGLYGGTGIFSNPVQGRTQLEDWGYLGGYETGFEPEEGLTAVLNGRYYAAVEVHLFKNASGARDALAYFASKLDAGSHRVSAAKVGNESGTWKLTTGTIPGSNIEAVYHRVVFRRGNLVAVVQTYGSDVLMNADIVLGLAAVVDQKAMGKRPAVEPTPLSAPAGQ